MELYIIGLLALTVIGIIISDNQDKIFYLLTKEDEEQK